MKVLLLGDPQKILAPRLQAEGCLVVNRTDKLTLEPVLDFGPDWIVSYNYRYLVRKDVLEAVKCRAINLHISFLPWNRGADPNPWSFLEDSPKGVTIHQIDEGVDTGPILAQKEVALNEGLTLRQSYDILNSEIQNLFWDVWPRVDFYFTQKFAQPTGGSIHYLKDRFRFIDCLPSSTMWDISAGKFIGLYRAKLKSSQVLK